MSDKKPTSVHLSTLILLVVLSGLLLGLNLRGANSSAVGDQNEIRSVGWPLSIYCRDFDGGPVRFNFIMVLGDLAVAGLILVVVAKISEGLIKVYE